MNILITGGTGLIGSELVSKLRKKGHEVRVLVQKLPEDSFEYFWDIKKKIIDEKAFENLNCIIHLAGASIFQRWTEKNKKAIISSRVDTANFLLEKVKKLGIRLGSFISASGINFYGTLTTNQIFNENDGIFRQDFLSEVCEKWENAAHNFQNHSEKVTILRISPVLSKHGGSFTQLQKVTHLNLASALGSGKQWFPWIHIEDLIGILVETVENKKINGIYNAVADEIPTNKELMKQLAEKNGKFFIPINIPSFALKLVLGEMSEMLLQGSRASNEKIKSEGFQFKFPNLEKALEDLISK